MADKIADGSVICNSDFQRRFIGLALLLHPNFANRPKKRYSLEKLKKERMKGFGEQRNFPLVQLLNSRK